MRTYTTSVNSAQKAFAVASKLIEASQWFTIEPQPDDHWHITVKHENVEMPDRFVMGGDAHVVYFLHGASSELHKIENICEYQFASRFEMDAFLEGIEVCDGWLENRQFDTYEEAVEHCSD